MKKHLDYSRRKFLGQSMGLGAAMMIPSWMSARTNKPTTQPMQVHIFSKHLQFLDYKGMAETAAEIGFDGVELTVRPKGHVLPERAAEDMPTAIEAIKKVGLKAEMMATGINHINDSVNQMVLDTASALGIQFYRLKYLSFSSDKAIPLALSEMNAQLKELAAYNAEKGIIGSYQNHAGERVGATIWDIYHLLQDIDPKHLGCQYDIRHAVVEGGYSWKNGLRLIKSQINSLVLKDFIWKEVAGKWRVLNVPFGEGMVDFKGYFALLKQYQISAPFSMHFEYDLGGAEHGEKKVSKADRKAVMSAMKRDLQKARQYWEEAE